MVVRRIKIGERREYIWGDARSRGIAALLYRQPSPLGNAIKLSGRTFLAPHRGELPGGLRGLRSGIT